MPSRKDEEIMAEYLLKGGKMLEKSCKTCGCPLFEVKGKTMCVVCAENAIANQAAPAASSPTIAQQATAHHGHAHEHHGHGYGEGCGCGAVHDEDECTCGDDSDGGLTEELAYTIHSLCERVQNEKDPNHVLTLMTAIREGTEALETLCKL
ncbi:MAG: hypothetical protein GYA23_04190 [Methanomicrobiales archaeon]|nr:hypothetical protein [Methanomicrobiales archaeon]